MSLSVIVASAVVGAIAGGFVPRVAYRMSVPYGEPPRTSCPGCDLKFEPGAGGWMRLRSACPRCRTRHGTAVLVSALAGAAVCGGLSASIPFSPVLVLALVAGIAGVLLAQIDVACMRLPDVIVLPLLAFSTLTLAVVALATGDGAALVRALLAAVALGGFYLAVGIVVPSGVGLGDVKLALVLGLLLGWFGWGYVAAGAIIAQLIHGAIAVGMLLARRADRNTLLPMGPSLLAGAWLAIAVLPVLFSIWGDSNPPYRQVWRVVKWTEIQWQSRLPHAQAAGLASSRLP